MKKDIKSLTGIRGVAAFMVMVHHFLGYNLGESRLAVFSVHLYLAVDLFFVLSGFVMALTYYKTFESGFSLTSYKTFLRKRFARIYPLYAFATIFCGALIYFGIMEIKEPDSLPYAILTNTLLIAGWGFGPYIIGGPAWSISVEWAAYILFPLLATFALFKKPVWAFVSAVAAIAVLWFLGTLPDEAYNQFNGRGGPLAIMNSTTVGPLLRCLGGFTIGLLAFRATKNEQIMKVLTFRFVPELLCVAILVLLFGRTTDLKIVLLCAALIASLSAEKSLASTVLGSKIPFWLGTYSFSIYLMHIPLSAIIDATPMQEAVPLAGNSLVMIVVKIALTLVVSYFTYNWLENPCRKLLSPKKIEVSEK